ncbi:hypothetical protein D0809_27725, partial [Flavobacterium circumlabens]
SKELRTKLYLLKSRGTQHESFIDFMAETSERGKRNHELMNKFGEEMKKMDEDERIEADIACKGLLNIHLFPIGIFKFPKAELENVLEVLNVKEDVKDKFRQLFGMIIPVINILNESVECEGY